MNWEWCRDCFTHHDTGKHHPLWLIWCPEQFGEDLDDARTMRAPDARTAVEKWAEWSDSQGDYTIVGGSDCDVMVRGQNEEKITQWRVIGESVPEYTASMLHPKKGKSRDP